MCLAPNQTTFHITEATTECNQQWSLRSTASLQTTYQGPKKRKQVELSVTALSTWRPDYSQRESGPTTTDTVWDNQRRAAAWIMTERTVQKGGPRAAEVAGVEWRAGGSPVISRPSLRCDNHRPPWAPRLCANQLSPNAITKSRGLSERQKQIK